MSTFAPNLSTGPCLYCSGMAESGPEEMLRCEMCRNTAHICCLKSGTPDGMLEGDNFFTFTCALCKQSDQDITVRAKLNIPQLLLLVLYNLHISEAQNARKGFYHWKVHIYQYINQHWKEIFGPERHKKKKKTLQASLSGQLSHYGQYFVSGYDTLQDGGWYRLSMVLPPAQLIGHNTKAKAPTAIHVKEESIVEQTVKEEITVKEEPEYDIELSSIEVSSSHNDESSQGSWFMEKDILRPHSLPPLTLFDSEEEMDESQSDKVVVKREEEFSDDIDMEFIDVDDHIIKESSPERPSKTSLLTIKNPLMPNSPENTPHSPSPKRIAGESNSMASRFLNPEQILNLPEDIETDLEDDTDVEEEDEDPTETISVVNRLDVQDDEPVKVNIEENDPITITVIESHQHDDQSQKKDDQSQKKDDQSQRKDDQSQKETSRKWKKKEEKSFVIDFTPKLPKQHVFQDAMDSFNLYFDDEMIDLIHYQTNLKSVQEEEPAEVTKEEIKVFLGINVIMGYSRYNRMDFYWKNGKDIGNQSIKESMSRNRFYEILSCLHLNDNTHLHNNRQDKLFKLRPFIDRLNKSFFENKSPEEHLSIDESMIKFKGRSSLKQYNPMKPIKRGFKLWCLSDDSGYIYNFSIYCGKHEESCNTTRSEFGLGGEVVLSLTKNITRQHHKLYFDNYFSSIPLLEKLQELQFHSCGTIRASRKGFPELANDKTLKRGDYDFRSTARGITVYKWKDTKPVHFISNYHGTESTTVTRKQKNGQKLTVKCPRVASDYNKHMGGVDKHDMLKQIYGIDRKSVKWWHSIFFGLLDMSVVNAFTIYREDTGSPLSLLDFRREIGLGLLTNVAVKRPFAAKRRKISYSVPESMRFGNVGVHFPLFNQPKGRCEVCSKQKIESRPTSKCSFCSVNLCCNSKKNCFTTYHTQK